MDTEGNLLRVWVHPADLPDREAAWWWLEVVRKAAGQQGFVVLPRRWVVERTFAWLGRNRRLAKDFEQVTECSETWVYLASIRLLLTRLAPVRIS